MALIAIPFFSSCNSKTDEPSKYALVTIREFSGPYPYIGILDNNQKMYFGNVRGTYSANDGQRAIVYFNELEESVPGFDINADIYYISNILTKNTVTLREQQLDTLGTSPISITRAWIGGGYMNIEYAVAISPYSSKVSFINLVDNRLLYPDQDDDYYKLQLRHKRDDDVVVKDNIVKGMACFRLADIGYGEDFDGIEIEYDSIYSGKKSVKVKKDKESVVNDL